VSQVQNIWILSIELAATKTILRLFEYIFYVATETHNLLRKGFNQVILVNTSSILMKYADATFLFVRST